MRLITLLFISVLFSNLITAQTSICKEDGRFMGAIQSTNIRDEIGLMQNFKLDMQWWTLLGEPTEYYDITWESSGQYKIEMDGELRFMKRSWLGKYPDLLNRFNRITPVDLKIEIAGYAYANNKCENQGSSSGESSLVGHVTYLIPDANLVPSYAGNNGKGIVPGSEHWNQFISWSGKADWCQTLNSSNQCDYSNFERGDKSDKELLRANKNKFRRAETIDLSARLFNIEWPETELRNIIVQYDKYEKGTETPPKSIVDELNQELSDLSSNNNDEYEIKREYINRQFVSAYVVATDGRMLIPKKGVNIVSYDPKTGLATVEKPLGIKSKNGSCDRVFKYEVFERYNLDSSGKKVGGIQKIARDQYDLPPLYLTVGYFDETAEEKAERERAQKERAAREKRCREQNQTIHTAFKQELKSQGFKIE